MIVSKLNTALRKSKLINVLFTFFFISQLLLTHSSFVTFGDDAYNSSKTNSAYIVNGKLYPAKEFINKSNSENTSRNLNIDYNDFNILIFPRHQKENTADKNIYHSYYRELFTQIFSKNDLSRSPPYK